MPYQLKKIYINSIKVRLKHDLSSNDRLLWKFQFHKGTIKTDRILHHAIMNVNFNSIKVRLKPLSWRRGVATHLFQFHKGTIKTT